MHEHDPVNFNMMLYMWDQWDRVAKALTLDLNTIPDEQHAKQQNRIDELKKKCGVR